MLGIARQTLYRLRSHTPFRRISYTFFHSERDPLRSPVDVPNSQRPEGHQIHPGHELAQERWQEFPVPAKKVTEDPGHTEVENVVGWRSSTFKK